MEPQFKTSFIPKQTLRSQEAPHLSAPRRQNVPMSIAMAVSFVLLLGALGASASLYAYKQHLQSSINDAQATVKAQHNAFEPAQIKEYTRAANRIESVKNILDKHDAMTFVFALLEQTTLKRVQYKSMTLAYDPTAQTADLTMVGIAKDFRVLALQADVYGSNQFFHNPAMGDLEAQDDGTIKFKMTTRLDPRLVSYKLGFQQGAYDSAPPGGAPATPAPTSSGGL